MNGYSKSSLREAILSTLIAARRSLAMVIQLNEPIAIRESVNGLNLESHDDQSLASILDRSTDLPQGPIPTALSDLVLDIVGQFGVASKAAPVRLYSNSEDPASGRTTSVPSEARLALAVVRSKSIGEVRLTCCYCHYQFLVI